MPHQLDSITFLGIFSLHWREDKSKKSGKSLGKKEIERVKRR